MTFGVTPQGFKAKQFSDIMEEIAADLKSDAGVDISSGSDTLADIYTNIISLAISDTWKQPQDQQGMFSIDSAEKNHLEDLVNYIGLKRELAAPSQGNVYITADAEFELPKTNSFYDIYDTEFVNPNPIPVKVSQCVSATFSLADSIPSGTVVSITVQGEVSSVTVGTDYAVALNALSGDITSSDNTATSTVDVTGAVPLITIQNEVENSNVTIIPSSFTTLQELTSKGVVISLVDGATQVLQDTVTTPPSYSQIISVTNRENFILGRLVESDEDLRARHKVSLNNTGSCTVDSITAAISNLTGVTSAVVLENDTMTATDIPEKAFHCIVQGGSDQDIADTIWANKAGGIKTYGNTEVAILNSQRDLKYVNFSRLEALYVHAIITFKKYTADGESFPQGGEELLKARLVSYGTSLIAGKDLIPNKFAADLLINTLGTEDVTVKLVTTTGQYDTPNAGAYSVTKPIPVELWQQGVFDVSRVTVEENI